MVYLIIVVAILLVIGPIIAILPSKRQKEQMAMRKVAMSRGLSVQLVNIRDPDPAPDAYLSNTGKPLEPIMKAMAYRIARRRPTDWRLIPQVDWCVFRKRDAPAGELPAGWAYEREPGDQMSNDFKGFLATHLDNLPSDVIKVEEVNYLLSVYWNERGGLDAVNAVLAFVDECREIAPYQSPTSEHPS